MKDFLETTLGRILLGVVVLLIWGINAFNFSKLSGDEVSTVISSSDELSEISIPAKVKYTYTISGRRDPFNQTDAVEPARIQTQVSEVNQYRPEIILYGIFGNTAMLSINNTDPVFIGPGEFLEDGVLLKRIYTDSVHIEIGDQQVTLTINE